MRINRPLHCTDAGSVPVPGPQISSGVSASNAELRIAVPLSTRPRAQARLMNTERVSVNSSIE